VRNKAIAALFVVAIIASAAVGYLVGNVNEHTTTLYSSTSLTQTITLYTSTTSTSTSTTTECTISGMPQGVNIRVLTDAGSPVAGAEVSGQTEGDQCGDFSIPTTATNSTGWLSLGGAPGAYNLTVSYSGRDYNIGATQYPISLTTIILKVPSGFWTMNILEGTLGGLAISGPSFVSNNTVSPYLNVTLGSSSVKQGDYLPIMVAFVGAGASGASGVDLNMTVTNSMGAVMFSISQAMPSSYISTGAANLRGLSGYLGWNADYHTASGGPVPVGTYTLSITAVVGGNTLRAAGSFQVTSS
jgi:hypothetical protein